MFLAATSRTFNNENIAIPEVVFALGGIVSFTAAYYIRLAQPIRLKKSITKTFYHQCFLNYSYFYLKPIR
jgi:hypothetical protein